MRLELQSYSLLKSKNKRWFLFLLIILKFSCNSQIVNYINNGSFEESITNSLTPNYVVPKFWSATDSTEPYFGELLMGLIPPIRVPYCSFTYQWPRTGNNHFIALQYCSSCPIKKRGYPRNRLKSKLKANASYCFSMYVNLSNSSTYAVSNIGAYFADESIDTITKCTIGLNYLVPQIENNYSNIISDTLRWVLIRGQFIANGNEKYALIGNFQSDINTHKELYNPTNLPGVWADYLIDDVSLIETELPAFAGNDTVIYLGDSIYLGRERDIGIDEACIWFKLTSPTTSQVIDTLAGFWVKPSVTSTYVVKQEICGNVKWDTVTVFLNAVGVDEVYNLNELISVYPVPSSDFIEIQITNNKIFEDLNKLVILNNLGKIIFTDEFNLKNNSNQIDIRQFQSGSYILELSGPKVGVIRKKIVVNR